MCGQKVLPRGTCAHISDAFLLPRGTARGWASFLLGCRLSTHASLFEGPLLTMEGVVLTGTGLMWAPRPRTQAAVMRRGSFLPLQASLQTTAGDFFPSPFSY